MAAGPIRWCTPSDPLSWRQWPDAPEWVVFNPASGDLHLLNEPAAAVLRVIERGPATISEIADRLAAAGAVPGAPDAASLEQLIESLDGLGLIEPEHVR